MHVIGGYTGITEAYDCHNTNEVTLKDMCRIGPYGTTTMPNKAENVTVYVILVSTSIQCSPVITQLFSPKCTCFSVEDMISEIHCEFDLLALFMIVLHYLLLLFFSLFVHLNTLLKQQSSGHWFEMPWWSCDITLMKTARENIFTWKVYIWNHICNIFRNLWNL